MTLFECRPLLILGYAHGVQIWDVSNLGNVSEVLSLSLASLGALANDEEGEEKALGVVQAGFVTDDLLGLLYVIPFSPSSVRLTEGAYVGLRLRSHPRVDRGRRSWFIRSKAIRW